MKYFLPLLGLVMLSACTISPRRGRSGQLAPEREMMHPDHFPTDSMQPDTLR